MLLRALGHRARVAHDGVQALAMAEDWRPELVLLDIGLPGMDGYEVARRLRATEHGRRVRLVAVTGYGQDQDVKRAQDAGFDAHLLKPVGLDALARLLATGPAAQGSGGPRCRL
jgi:CheY-like chemotaxis protein